MLPPLAPYDVAYGTTGVLCLSLAGHRLYALIRYPSDYLARVVCLAFVSTSVAFTVAAPTVYLAVDGLMGVGNAATLVVYSCILLTSSSFLTLLAAWTGQPRLRVGAWSAGYSALIVTLAVLFVLGRPDDAEHPIDFDAHHAAYPVLAEFLLLYYGGFAVAMVSTVALTCRYSRMAAGGRPWLARGLRCTAWGAGLGASYCGLKVIAVVGIMGGARTESLSTVWAPLSATAGALLIAVGLSLPRFAPRADAALGRVLAFRRLYPLWRLLTGAVPFVVLEPGPPSWRRFVVQRWALRDVTHRLYRRVVEIHDARLALAPWLDPGAEDAVGSRPDAAFREATMLVGAVRAKERGASAPRHGHPSRDPGGEWSDQLDWLLAVARQLRRVSPGEAGPTPREGRCRN